MLGISVGKTAWPSTGHLTRVFSPMLWGQWKPDFSEFLYLVFEVTWATVSAPPVWTAMDPKEEWS